MDYSNSPDGTVLYFKVRSTDEYTPFEMEFTATINHENRYMASLGMFSLLVMKNGPVTRRTCVLQMMLAGPNVEPDKILSIISLPHTPGLFKKVPTLKSSAQVHAEIEGMLKAMATVMARKNGA